MYAVCLGLIVIGPLIALIGLVQLSPGPAIVGILLAGAGIEGIAWEVAHRGPRHPSPRDR
jgi:energy-converting hydrogenase Eha subunit B